MDRFRKILPYLKNKYILSLVAFIVLVAFFDRNNLFVQLQRKRDLNKLLSNQEFYQKEIDSTRKQLQELRENPQYIQKYAREGLFMRKDSEDVFVIDQPVDSTGSGNAQ